MLHTYQEKDANTCMHSKEVVFIGDSVTRQLYFQLAHLVDPRLPSQPPDDEHKHQDYDLMTSQNLKLTFHWDPFLNSSATTSYIRSSRMGTRQDRVGLLVLGSGLWYLRYSDTSGGLPAWESMIERVLHTISDPGTRPADLIAILPIENVVSSKLSPDRAATMHASDIDAMNSDLSHRIIPPSLLDPFSFLRPAGPPVPIFFPSVFNQMLDPSQTEDGLHFSGTVLKMQAQILLNLRCNDALPKRFPLDSTCCRSYPWPSPLHFLVILGLIAWGPVYWFLCRRYSAFSSTDIPGCAHCPT